MRAYWSVRSYFFCLRCGQIGSINADRGCGRNTGGDGERFWDGRSRLAKGFVSGDRRLCFHVSSLLCPKLFLLSAV